MSKDLISRPVQRRTLLKAGLAIGAMQVASPFVVKSLADEPIKIGLDNPLTGTFAALGKNELIGCSARRRPDQRQGRHPRPQGRSPGRGLDQRRRRHRRAEGHQAGRARQGRLPHRQYQLGAGPGDGQLHLREEGVPHRARRPHRLRHRHAVPLERVPRLQHDAHGDQLGLQAAAQSYGKKWYFITTDYAFGHGLQAGFEASLKAAGGTELGNDFTPLGTTDFSANLIKAQSDQSGRDRACCSPATT